MTWRYERGVIRRDYGDGKFRFRDLLIVFGIIALLIGISVPAVKELRRQAKLYEGDNTLGIQMASLGPYQAPELAADWTTCWSQTNADDEPKPRVNVSVTSCSGDTSLFVAEGLLVYLDQRVCARLLAGLAERAAPGSVLAASLATHADGHDSAQVAALANSRRRAAATEPWLTILPVADHLALVTNAGWRVTRTEWVPAAVADVSHGRRSLLVAARL